MPVVKVEIICHQKKNKKKYVLHLRVFPSDIILLVEVHIIIPWETN